MYVFVRIDKPMNHCTAFKPKCSPWDITIHMQIYKSGNLAASRGGSLCVPVERSWGFRASEKRNQENMRLRALPAGGLGLGHEESDWTWWRRWGATGSCMRLEQNEEPNKQGRAKQEVLTNCSDVWEARARSSVMAWVDSSGKASKILKRFLVKFLEWETKPNISDPPGTLGSDQDHMRRAQFVFLVTRLKDEDWNPKYVPDLWTSVQEQVEDATSASGNIFEVGKKKKSLVWEWGLLNPQQENQPPGCFDELRRFL